MKRIGKFIGGGAIASAIGASLCCSLPLVATLLGLGLFSGASAFFESVRPYFLGAAGLLLSGAWLLAFKQSKQAVACACDAGEERAARANRRRLVVSLSIATLFAGGFALLPNVLSALEGNHAEVRAENPRATVVLAVEGMTCGGCVSAVQSALEAVPGVARAHVSLADKRARVELSDANVSAAALFTAIENAGYAATVLTSAGSEAR